MSEYPSWAEHPEEPCIAEACHRPALLRMIAELEAQVKELDADNTTHLLAKEELADRVIELEAEVERLTELVERAKLLLPGWPEEERDG